MDSSYYPNPANLPAPLPAQPTSHPLFERIEAYMYQGNWWAAQASLAELIELYPGDRYLRELMAAAQARSALSGFSVEFEAAPASRPILARGARLVVPAFFLMALLCVAVGIFVSLQWWILPQASNRRLESQINKLRQEAQAAMTSGDYDRAVLAYNELLRLAPDDREAERSLKEVNELRVVVSLYSEAIAEMEAHRWQSALSILNQIQAEQPGYRDVAERISFVKMQQDLDSRFAAAEVAFKQGDYSRAVQEYEAIRAVDYNFQNNVVQEHLFLSYLQLGLAEEEAAGSDAARLRKALDLLEKALALRPTDSQAEGESRLLRQFLSGLAAFKARDWSQVIADLTPVYEARPDFAGGTAATLLYNAYMAWGDALLADGEAEDALAAFKAARSIRGADAVAVAEKIVLAEQAALPPTPEATSTPPPPAVPALISIGGAPAPTPTPALPQMPYAIKSMAIRNNCGGAYIHGIVWNAYNLPLAGVTVQAINTTTGAGPYISNPTNADGIYQIILNPDDLDGLWMVQILENGTPMSLGWGQRLGGGCVNGAQELKVDWQRELEIN